MKRLLAIILCVTLLVSCEPTADKQTPTVMCTIPPQAWIVENLCGTEVETFVILPEGANPATFRPNPKLLNQSLSADYLLLSGLPIEFSPWHQTIQRETDTQSIDLNTYVTPLAADPENLCACCNADGLDPHVWLDPIRLQAWASSTAEALAQDPRIDSQALNTQLALLQEKLKLLHAELTVALAPLKNKPFAVVHPSWGYIADRYHLTQMPFEPTGYAPSDVYLHHLHQSLFNENIGGLITQTNTPSALIWTLKNEWHLDTYHVDELHYNPIESMKICADAIRASHQLPPYFSTGSDAL